MSLAGRISFPYPEIEWVCVKGHVFNKGDPTRPHECPECKTIWVKERYPEK